ncbi:hypothetical protein [Corynebacterium resistens]|uniref:hypothetical protein n=1 Tax=Corynebacterium resistens TaxID=258224 RepID=UPI0023572403|nr:hypothetical protein [Corynebacterium resistens]
MPQDCKEDRRGERHESGGDEQAGSGDVSAEESGECDGQWHEGDGDEEVEAGDSAEHLQRYVFLQDRAPDDHPDSDRRTVDRQSGADDPRIVGECGDGQWKAAECPCADHYGQEV